MGGVAQASRHRCADIVNTIWHGGDMVDTASIAEVNIHLLDQTTILADAAAFQKVMDWLDAEASPPAGRDDDACARFDDVAECWWGGLRCWVGRVLILQVSSATETVKRINGLILVQ